MTLLLCLALQAALTPPVDEMALAAATASVESDNDPAATACPGEPRARTARLYYDDPTYASPAHPCYCGLYQTTATSRAECLRQRSPEVAIAAWRAQRAAWRRICVSRRADDVELCTIAGYAVGGDGVEAAAGGKVTKAGRWGVAYARRLLWLARRRARGVA